MQIEEGSTTKATVIIPSFIFEMKKKAEKDKILAQTRYYIMDCFGQFNKTHRMILTCEFMIQRKDDAWLDTGTLSLKGYLSRGPKTDGFLDQILIWEGPLNEKSLSMIIQALLKGAAHNVLGEELGTSPGFENVLDRLVFLFKICFALFYVFFFPN